MSRPQGKHRSVTPARAVDRAVRQALPCLAEGLLADALAQRGWTLPLQSQQLVCLHRAAALLLYRLALLVHIETRGLGEGSESLRPARKDVDLCRRLDGVLRNLADASQRRVYVGPLLAGRLREATHHADPAWLEAVRFLRRHRVSDAVLSDVLKLVRGIIDPGEAAGSAPTYPQQLGWLHERVMAVALHTLTDGAAKRRTRAPAAPVRLAVRRWRTGRKATGSFYTPDAIVQQVVSKAVQPALREHLETVDAGTKKDARPTKASARRLLADALDFAVLDPAMGCGQFLAAAVEAIADTTHTWLVERGVSEALGWLDMTSGRAQLRAMVLASCVFGVDSDPVGVELARTCLSLQAGAVPATFDDHFRWGDSVVGRGPDDAEGTPSQSVLGLSGAPVLDWPAAFEDVFRRNRRRGFDVVVGNPPWISFSGRQRQAAPTTLMNYWSEHYQGFAGWRSTHGLFLERAVKLIGSKGYVGLVLPLQVCDLSGYGRLRRVVEQYASLVEPVTEIGEDGFGGVTGPAGIYVVVRHAGTPAGGRSPAPPWPRRGGGVRRVRVAPSLPQTVVQKVRRFEPLPPKTFGDPGVHTGNSARLLISDRPGDGQWAPIRVGRDVSRYQLGPAKMWLRLDLQSVDGRYWRIAAPETYSRARLLLRQTANRPIAAAHCEPTYFRNSALAFYGVEGWDDDYVLALLNSKLIACAHRLEFGDAAQRSFPQVKVSHLQGLRLPPYVAQHLSKDQNLLLGRMIRCLQSAQASYDASAMAVRCGLATAPTVIVQRLLAHAARMMVDLTQTHHTVQKSAEKDEARQTEASVQRLDGVIDRLVYRLYDLRRGEIAAIEKLAVEAVGV
jgi:hypothetical protein